jgi:hypothetical protein
VLLPHGYLGVHHRVDARVPGARGAPTSESPFRSQTAWRVATYAATPCSPKVVSGPLPTSGLPGASRAGYEIADPAGGCGWTSWTSPGEAGDPAWSAIVPRLSNGPRKRRPGRGHGARRCGAPATWRANSRCRGRRRGERDRCRRKPVRSAIEHGVTRRSAWRIDSVRADTVAVLAQLTAFRCCECARLAGADASRAWQAGSYRPVCGVWRRCRAARHRPRPTASRRMLRRGLVVPGLALRVLRQWTISARPAPRRGRRTRRRVETCESCHGYLKSVTTLGALPFRTLALEDLTTVPLDLAARDRGFSRPPRPGWQPRITLVA